MILIPSLTPTSGSFLFTDMDSSKPKIEQFKIYIEDSVNVDKFNSMLNVIANFENNWDGFGALKIEQEVIEKTKRILSKMRSKPILVAGSLNSIQMELGNVTSNYLEIEIFSDKIEMYRKINGVEDEREIQEEEIVELEGLLID